MVSAGYRKGFSMRRLPVPLALCFLSLTACGASDDRDADTENLEEKEPAAPATDETGFPPAPEGYTRIDVPTMPDLPPGSDIMYCQYVYGPLDHDMDILDVSGYQSIGGHHSIAYATTVSKPIGTSGPCQAEENLAGGYLGGIGGEGGSNAKLPDGVGFRLPAGQLVMLNTHFLNTTDETIDGKSVLDVRFADVDPDRLIASLFVNINVSFELPPQAHADAVAECTVPRDMEVIMYANHMHDFGSNIWTDLTRAGSDTPEMIHEDTAWSYEMQFNAEVRNWSPSDPLILREGDTIRTHCNWENTTNDRLGFPREMCVGFGYFLGDGSSSPVCFDGNFLEEI
jgi:hypothetical protein